MQFMTFVFVFVAALLALEGLTELFSRRRDPARVRNRLSNLAARVGNVEVENGDSILRRRGSSHIRNMFGFELLLYRAGSLMSVGRFLAVSVALAALGFVSAYALTHDSFRSAPMLLLGVLPLLSIRSRAKKTHAGLRRSALQRPRAGHSLDAQRPLACRWIANGGRGTRRPDRDRI